MSETDVTIAYRNTVYGFIALWYKGLLEQETYNGAE
jgi:hypothetical protein